MRLVAIETQKQKLRHVVIDDTGQFIEPIIRYLKYADRTGSARYTLRSYAFALKQYWGFLAQEQLDWQQITIGDFSKFILWLKLPTNSLNVLPLYYSTPKALASYHQPRKLPL